MFGFLTPYFIFQSTLPREERPSSSCVVHPTTLFQSTLPREERRCLGVNEDIDKLISIHASTRGATFWIRHKGYNFYISIHASTRGATRLRVGVPGGLQFQSTLPREERQFERVL